MPQPRHLKRYSGVHWTGYFNPDGDPVGPPGFPPTASSCPFMSLVGTIAGSGVYHCLGQQGQFAAEISGDLVLFVNDLPGLFADNAGVYVALVTIPR